LIFVDTSFLIATNLLRDRRHADARSLMQEHEGDQLATTNHVLGETWTFIRNRASMPTP
jgi:predicted nucleic acid-binding protein